MSKHNKFHDRLDELFADLEEQAAQSSKIEDVLPNEDTLPGWTWECDPQGTITSCSPEVENVLGLSHQRFLGQSLFSFKLSDQSKGALQVVFNQGNFPEEIILQYQGNEDQWITIRSHIFPIESIDNMPRGWRGFNHITSSSQIQPDQLERRPFTPGKVPQIQPPRLFDFEHAGFAAEDDKIITISKPFSPSDETSFREHGAMVVNATLEESAELAVPIELQDKSLGILEIIDDSPNRKWTQDEKRLVEQVVDQLGLALENAHLFQETQISLSRTEALYNVGQAAIGFERLEELLQAVVDTIGDVLPADRVQIAVGDFDKGQITHYYQSYKDPIQNEEKTYQELVEGVTGWCIQERKPAFLTNSHTHPQETLDAYNLRIESDSGSVLMIPLVYHENIFGLLTAINRLSQPDFNESDADMLTAMSNQVATTLANARLFQEEQRRRQIADTLSQTARVVGASLDLEEVGNHLLAQLAEAIQFDTAFLYIIEGNNPRLISILNTLNDEYNSAPQKHSLTRLEDPIIQSLFQSGQPIVIPDTLKDARWTPRIGEKQARSWIGAPLLFREVPLGLLFLEHAEPDIYDEETADLISAIAAQVSVAIRNAGLYHQVQRRSIQLQTAAEVSRAASSILEPNPLIQQTVNLIQERFNLYYVGLFLVDDTGELTREPGRWAILRAGTGEAGRIQIERVHKLEIGPQSMIGECILTSKAQTPKTLYENTPHYLNPLLPQTRTEIAIPLVSRGAVIGAMSIQSDIENAFGEDDVAILQTMADQVANALQNAYLFNQTQARAEDLDILNEMSRALSRDLDMDTILRNVYLYASRLVDTSTFFIALYDPETNEISFPFAIEDNREISIPTRPLSTGLTEYVIRNRETILIHNNVKGWLEQNNVELRLTGSLPQSWLGVPLTIGEQILGIVCVQNEKQHHFSEHHGDLLNAVANQSAIVLQNAQLFTQTQDALSDTEALLNITSVATSSLELQETFTNVLSQVLETINSEAGLISNVNSQTKKLELVAHQLPDQMLESIQKNGLEGSLCDWVYQQAKPLVLENLEETAPTETSGAIALGFASYQGVPIEAKGRVLGTLCTFSSHKLTHKHNDLSLLHAVGQQIGVAIENANLFEQTQRQAAELAVLNEMSRVLSTLFEIDEIIKTIHEYTSRLMDTTNFFVALYDEREDELSFPFVTEQGVVSSIPKMKKRRGLTQHVIDTKQSLLISKDVKHKTKELGLEEIVVGDPAESWLGVPLLIGDDVLGVIATQNADTPGVFNERHQDLLISVARQSAIAIQTARLFQETHRQTEDLALLNEMGRVLTNMLDRNDVMETVYKFTSQLMDTTNFSIATYNQNRQEITYEYRVEKGQKIEGYARPLGDTFTDYILRSKTPLLLEDDIPIHYKRLGVKSTGSLVRKSWLGVPMMAGDDAIGIIALHSLTTPRLYTERHRDLLMSIASQTAISLQNVQLFNQVQTSFQETTALYQAGADLNAVQSYADILDVMRNHTILGRNAEDISIGIFDQLWTETGKPGWLIPIARWSQTTGHQDPSERLALSTWTNADQFLSAKTPTIIQDPTNDPRLDQTTQQIYVDAQGLIFVPLVLAGNWFGVITTTFKKPSTFSEAEIQRVMTMAGQAAVAFQNLRSLEDSIRKSGQLETAAEIARDTSATLSVNELLNRSVNAVRDRFGFYHASIFLLDDSNQNAVIQASTGEAGLELIRQKYQLQVGAKSVIGEVTKSGQALLINDTSQSDIYRPHSLLPETKAELGTPLKIGNRIIGVLNVQSSQINAFNEDDVAVIQTLADQISVAIDNARSYQLVQEAIEETRRRVRDLTTLSAASQTLASAPLEIKEVASIIAQQVGEIISEKSTISIFLRDSLDLNLMKTLVNTQRHDGSLVRDGTPDTWDFDLSKYPSRAEVVANLEPRHIHGSDIDVNPPESSFMQELGIGTLLMIPLTVKGQVIGLLRVETWQDEYHYSIEETNLLTTLANQAAVSLENARLYQEQLETADQLRELERLKSQFLANMSHELRTPLNSIIGFSRVIMKGIDGPITDLQQQDLSAIYNAGQHLLKMINDILDISKIDAGKMDLAFEEVTIGDIITSVVSTARGLVKDKPVQLVTAVADNIPIVNADPTRIRQVLLNLLSNATKFTDEGTITVTAEKQINETGLPEVYISVTDTGIGIAPEDQRKLFEPFVQVDGSPTRSTGGTGLGLSITRMLVELHHGQIGLVSDIGKGSTFFFSLPLDDPGAAIPSSQSSSVILAIDDDLQVIHLYEQYLGGTDFKIIPLKDADNALAYARETQPFLITLDVLLSGKDGWQLLKELKEDPETSHIPVIICSIRDETQKGLEMGADDYLVKPILSDDFIKAVQRIWDEANQDLV